MSLKDKEGITLLELIGSGGFGHVYKCRYKEKICALKQIKFIKDSRALQMIAAEVEIMQKMVHPRIVRFIKFFFHDNKWNILLEYMGGGSLGKLIDTRKKKKQYFTQSEILLYFKDIAEGVAFLHAKNIIHRDLKPDNILLDERNRAKIADFGISKMLSDFGAFNKTVIGTPSYWAPELARNVSYDISVDIWSLGVIFYEMALLEHPYGWDDHKIMHRGYAPPTIPEKRYSRSLTKMLEHFMQYEPSKRIKAQKFVEFLNDYTGYSWVPSSINKGLSVGNAIHAGNDIDGSAIYVGRAFHNGDQLPAKVIPSKPACYVSYNGLEIFKPNYELLSGHYFTWVGSSNGLVPPGAISAGNTADGEPLYVGRAHHKGSVTPGKIRRSHGCLYIPFDGREISILTYEVLVLEAKSK